MRPITVLLAEDHAIVREGFRKLLELDPGLQVVGEAQDGRRVVELAKKLRPDVILMDIAMPLLNGLEATRQVLKAVAQTKILILSAHSDDAYVQNATESGAAGFILKQTSANIVCRAIREVKNGKTFFSPSLVRRIREREAQPPGRAGGLKPRRHQLSSREAEVLQLIAEGKANKQMAAELGISVKTVEKHRENLMAKLKIHDTAGLTRYAMNAGVIESNIS